MERITQDLLYCLLILHRNTICHFDIKLANIFYITQDSTYFLCDFGEAIQFKREDNQGKFIKVEDLLGYTPFFNSPEVDEAEFLDDQSRQINPYKFDIYSLGVCLGVLLLNRDEIDKLKSDYTYIRNNKKLAPSSRIQKLKELNQLFQTYLTTIHEKCNNVRQQDIIKIIKNMINYYDQDRPTIYEIFQQNRFLLKEKNLKLILQYYKNNQKLQRLDLG